MHIVTGLPEELSGIGVQRCGRREVLVAATADLNVRMDALRSAVGADLSLPEAAEALVDDGSPAPRWLLDGLAGALTALAG